jgi:hypothetical protein
VVFVLALLFALVLAFVVAVLILVFVFALVVVFALPSLRLVEDIKGKRQDMKKEGGEEISSS